MFTIEKDKSMSLESAQQPQRSGGGLHHRSTEAREAYKKSPKEESKAGDLLEFWSERNKDEKLLHETPKYLKDVCSKLHSPTVSSLVGTRSKFTPKTNTNGTTPTTPTMATDTNDSMDDVDGIWQSVLSDTEKVTTTSKRHNKYANTPSKLHQPTAASIHGQFKREILMSNTTSITMSPLPSSVEYKDEIPPHTNLKYAHITSKLLAPTAATIAARKVT